MDLYAGTGALGIEALSRGADRADFVEPNARLAGQLRENLRQLSLAGQARVYQARVERALDTLPGGYDLVFADPPYDMAPWDWLMGGLEEGDLIKEQGVVVVEYRSGATLAERYGRLGQVTSRRYGDTSVSMFRAGVFSG